MFEAPKSGTYRFTFSATSTEEPIDKKKDTIGLITKVRVVYNALVPSVESQFKNDSPFDIIDGSKYLGINLSWTWIKKLRKGETVALSVDKGALQAKCLDS